MLMYVSEKIESMIKKGMTFTADYCGESCNFFYPKMPEGYQKSKYFGKGLIIQDNSHLNRMVILEVKKRIENGDYISPEFSELERVKVSYVCPENIKKHFNEKCYAVDINNCYWNTAKNLGVISEKLYEYGMKEGINKNARNSSIGSLGAFTRHVEVVDGVVKKDINEKRITHPARTHVIKSVWGLALDVYENLKDDCLMFLTDCFFVSKNGLEKLYELLNKYNYESKCSDIVFINEDDSDNSFLLDWYSFTEDSADYKTLVFNQYQYINKILGYED